MLLAMAGGLPHPADMPGVPEPPDPPGPVPFPAWPLVPAACPPWPIVPATPVVPEPPLPAAPLAPAVPLPSPESVPHAAAKTVDRASPLKISRSRAEREFTTRDSPMDCDDIFVPFADSLAAQETHEPRHCRSHRAVAVHQSAVRLPRRADDVAPDRDAGDVAVIPEHRELALHDVLLLVVIGDIQVLLADVNRQARLRRD